MSQPTSFEYQWNRNGTPIPGATDRAYVVQAADLGDRISCTVTGVDSAGVTSVNTLPTSPVVSAGSPTPPGTVTEPVNTAVPVITGSPFVGSVLTATSGSWTQNPTGFAYQWEHLSGAGGSNTYDALIAGLGPSLWLKLDETSGTVVHDSSGNGFNGTYSGSGVTLGATNTAAGAGNDAGAVALTTGQISIPNNPIFTNLSTTSSTHWSVLMWVKLGSGFGAFPTFMQVGDGGNGPGTTGWNIFGNTTLAFKIQNTQTNESIPTPLTTLALIGVTWDGSQCHIWENGVNSFSESETFGSVTTDTTSPLIIAGPLAVVNQAMIFPTALSAGQMASIYSTYTSAGASGGTTAIPGATGSSYTVQSTDAGDTLAVTVVASNSAGPSAPATSLPTSAVTFGNLVQSITPQLWLKENETSGTTAADSSGNGFNGTYTSPAGTTYAVVNPDAGPGIGTNDLLATLGAAATISVPNHAVFTNLSCTALARWTVTGWFQLAPTNFPPTVPFPFLLGVGDGGTSSGTATGWQLFGSTNLVFKAANLQAGTTLAVPLSTLSYLGVTWDGTNLNIYQNGLFVAPPSGVSGAVVSDTTSPLVVGRALTSGQIVITNSALTAAQHSQLYQSYTASTLAPTNTILPAISGIAQAGQTLTISSFGTWTNGVTNGFIQQWFRNSGGTITAIGTATGTSYTVQAADVGDTITVAVVARNTNGSSAPAVSPPTGTVAAAPAPGATNIPTAPSGPATPAGAFRLVFADDFNGTSVDTNMWHLANAGPHNPWEWATYDSSQVSESNSCAVLTCVPRSEAGLNYVSGEIYTGNSSNNFLFSPQTGGPFYIEAKIKTPGGAPGSTGNFPAYWSSSFRTFGLSSNDNRWTREFDFFEFGLQPAAGSNTQMDSVNRWPPGGYGSGNADSSDMRTENVSWNPFNSFHLYTVQINSDGSFTLWVDGAHQWDLGPQQALDYMGIMFNYALGLQPASNFAGDTMQIDYVACWQAGSTPVGQGIIGGGLANGTVHP